MMMNMSSSIRYQLVKDFQTTLTHNLKGTVYVIYIVQCQILITELDCKEINHKNNISISHK